MGNAGLSPGVPDKICNTAIEAHTISNICITDVNSDELTPPDVVASENSKKYDREMGIICNKLGSEWRYDKNQKPVACTTTTESKTVINPDGETEVKFVDHGSGQFSGKTAICVRDSFDANDVKCCLNDLSFVTSNNPNSGRCFVGTSTCHPDHRDMSGENCQAVMNDFCTTGLFDDFVDNWTKLDPTISTVNKPPCIHALDRALYGKGKFSVLDPITNGGIVDENVERLRRKDGKTDGFLKARGLMKEVFEKFREDGFRLGAPPGSQDFSSFERTLYQICETEPGVCSEALADTCSSVTREELEINSQLRSWCGCHLSEPEYAIYTDNFGVPVECTPPCNTRGTIPKVKSDGRSISQCSDFGRGICIMDSININFGNIDSRPLNFKEICGSCGPNAGCTCFIVNQDINAINSSTGIDIANNCGSGTTCYKTDKEGKTTEIPCNKTIEREEMITNERIRRQNITRNIIIGVSLFLIVVIILIVLYLTRREGVDTPIGVPTPIQKAKVHPRGDSRFGDFID